MRHGSLQPTDSGYYNQEVALNELLNRYASSSANVTSVDDTASSTTLLAANTSRKGFSIYNDSTAILYVKAGPTASTSDFSFEIKPEGFYESWGGYRGIIDGIWASNQSGAAKVTEYV